jgi:hypothetical protein
MREVKLCLEFSLTGDAERDASAVRMARILPGFDPTTQDAGWARVRMSLEEAEGLRDVLLDLWEQVRSRPGARMLLGDRPMDLDDFRQVMRVLDCAKAYDTEGRGAAHCVSSRGGWDWGCLYLAHVAPGGGETGLDCEALHAILEREAASRWLDICRYYSKDRIVARLDALSDEKLQSLIRGNSGREQPRSVSLPDSQTGTPAEKTIPATTYADIGGLDHVVTFLRETIELPLRHPEVFRHLGLPPHRGVLLHGPPGCGKTLLARAVACESKARFFPISGPELITKWHGESEEKLRQVFREAQENQPAIIFFDEIDAIAQSRSSSESLRLDARFTAQLLTLMDGIHDLGRVCILAATNRPDLLDRALSRPGRFDAILAIPKPDAQGCLAILTIHTRKIPLAAEADLEHMARRLEGCTGADIAFVAREAARVCLRRGLELDALLAREETVAGEVLAGLRVTEQDMLVALEALRQREPAAPCG